jgi:hypothetical protein
MVFYSFFYFEITKMLSKYGTLLLELPPVYNQSYDDVARDANNIDHVFDVNKFTQENKTGRRNEEREGEREKRGGEREFAHWFSANLRNDVR